MKTVPTCVDVVPQFSASEASVLPSATSTIPHTLRSVRDERAESATARHEESHTPPAREPPAPPRTVPDGGSGARTGARANGDGGRGEGKRRV